MQSSRQLIIYSLSTGFLAYTQYITAVQRCLCITSSNYFAKLFILNKLVKTLLIKYVP